MSKNPQKKDDRPHKHGRGNNRVDLNDLQLSVIIECALRGMSAAEIAEVFKARTGRSLPPRKISVVIAEQNEAWAIQKQEESDFYMQRELARLEMMEREAWRQYQECGGTLQRETVNKLFNIDDDLVQRSVTIETKDDPKQAHTWFTTLMTIQKDRRKLLKLEQVIKFQANVLAMKSYVGWNPDRSWPDAPEQLDDPTVIDGEVDDSS